MDFYQIEQILAVARTGSITEAAKQMCVSQPTMSCAVAKAEEEFGVRLFDRSNYPLKLTYAGEQYVEAARKMKIIHRDLQKVCADASRNAAGILRIGIPNNRSAQILPRITRELGERFPNIRIHCQSGLSEDFKEQLHQGEFDFLVYTQVEHDLRFRYEPLFQEELLAVAATGIVEPCHLLPGNHQVLNLASLSQLPLLFPQERSGLGIMLRLLTEYYDIVPNIISRLGDNNTLFHMAAAGLGVAILPQNAIQQSAHYPQVKTYALSGHGIGWTVCAMFRRDAVISQVEQTILDLIRQKFLQEQALDLFPRFGPMG